MPSSSKQVIFSYDRTEVLHQVSFTLRKGEIVGLLGPNGAGKSTTIKLITGILVAAAGAITVAGLPLPEKAVDVKQIIGYVPETAVLFDSLTGQEFLELSGRLHNVPKRLCKPASATSSRPSISTSDRVARLDAYSKGMRQKILIAAALLHNPDIILLDEPLSGLDVNAAILIKDLLAALAADGKTILYSSHVLDVVETHLRPRPDHPPRLADRRWLGRFPQGLHPRGHPRRRLPQPHPLRRCRYRRLPHCRGAPLMNAILEACAAACADLRRPPAARASASIRTATGC